jgi:hypothetical protein
MSIVQYYKSRVKLNNQAFPILPNGATLSWNKNHVVPFLAGNFWQVNYIEGLQVPMFDVNFAMLDGNSANNPLVAAFMGLFLDRSNNYGHDVSAFAADNILMDGNNLLTFPNLKANSFMISGSKGDDIAMSANFMVYSASGVPITVADAPTHSLSDYTYFSGNPLRFQSLNFLLNGTTALENIVSFSFSFTNNLTADLSMRATTSTSPDVTFDTSGSTPLSATYQSPFPVDCNAGQMACSARFVMQTQYADNLQTGDSVDVIIDQNAIGLKFRLSRLVIDTHNVRTIGSGRQMRTLMATVVGTDNETPPVIVSSV